MRWPVSELSQLDEPFRLPPPIDLCLLDRWPDSKIVLRLMRPVPRSMRLGTLHSSHNAGNGKGGRDSDR